MLVPRRCEHWLEPELEVASPSRPVAEELKSWFVGQMDVFRPDLLVVDVFPRGVLGELPNAISVPKVLLTRWVAPDFYALSGVSEALEGCQAIFTSEPFTGSEAGAAAGRVVRTAPMLWTEAGVSREQARARLGGGREPLVLVLGSGPVKGQRLLKERMRDLCAQRAWQLRYLSSALEDEIVGAGRFLRGADLVVSAAGYQSYHEIVQAGVPAVFLPQRRQYDSQAQRALGRFGMEPRAPHGVARSPAELELCLDRLMGSEPAPPEKFQGAEQVAEYLSKAW